MSLRPSRRQVLRGLGCCLALPWLESLPAQDGADAKQYPTKRFATIYMPNGTPTDKWKAITSAGGGMELSPTLMPLQTHGILDQTVIPVNYMHQRANNGPGGHHPKMNFLSGERVKRSTTSVQVGTTIDQVIAMKIGKQTALPYLAMGTEGVGGGADFGFSAVYLNHISWASDTRPASRLSSPAKVFDALFGQKLTSERQRNLLDLVGDESKQIMKSLSGDDKRRMDEYLTSVRDLEKRITHMEEQYLANPPPPPPIPRPAEKITGVKERQSLLLDLMVLAFQMDRTRVLTMMLGNDVSRLNYSFLDGAQGTHHEFSHANSGDGRKAYQIISQYMVDLTAQAAKRMASIQEGERTLLDNSIILFGSTLSEGGAHNPANLPLLLIGGGGGWKTGRSFGDPKKPGNFCSIHLSIMQAMGLDIDSWGDADGPCSELAD